ncbi:GTPase IMAP family member 8-like [Paralichthys olivaceus]|uniref:GTPase IMAP family member 8-like n=1 Tax=Paralichthys olivaceus TaxID=8255 RepID=UPI0037527C1F
MEQNRAPPPPYPEKLTIALLGKKIDMKNMIGNMILNEQDHFKSNSDNLAMGENSSFCVINTPDFFDTECLSSDQRIIDFMAFSHPGLDLFILVVDSENTEEEKVFGQITRLQDIFGEQITSHLVVMLPNRESLQANDHLKEMFEMPIVVPTDNLPIQCRKWCPTRDSFVFEYKDYSQDVVLRRKAAFEKMRSNLEHNHGREGAAATGQSTLQGDFATAPQISTSILAVQDSCFNIIFLGLTGTGKSSSANTILAYGKSKQEITPFKSEASSIPITRCCDIRLMNKTFGLPVRLVDTPDFFHDDLRNPEVHIKECRRYCQRGQCVVLLVIQLGRFTDEETGILQRLEKRLGWKIREETILLLTHKDDLRENLSQHVQKHPKLNEIAQMCSYRIHTFDNKTKDKRQVLELFRKIPCYENRFPKIAKKEEDICMMC